MTQGGGGRGSENGHICVTSFFNAPLGVINLLENQFQQTSQTKLIFDCGQWSLKQLFPTHPSLHPSRTIIFLQKHVTQSKSKTIVSSCRWCLGVMKVKHSYELFKHGHYSNIGSRSLNGHCRRICTIKRSLVYPKVERSTSQK